jgi:hypothetical protein
MAKRGGPTRPTAPWTWGALLKEKTAFTAHQALINDRRISNTIPLRSKAGKRAQGGRWLQGRAAAGLLPWRAHGIFRRDEF